MPGIYRVSCDSCEFSRTEEIVVTVVRIDGKDEICAHPIEEQTAERLTGQKWDELFAEGRIGTRSALLCAACGEVGFYAAAEACAKYGRGPLLSITGPFDDVRCPECGTGELSSAMTAIS